MKFNSFKSTMGRYAGMESLKMVNNVTVVLEMNAKIYVAMMRVANMNQNDASLRRMLNVVRVKANVVILTVNLNHLEQFASTVMIA